MAIFKARTSRPHFLEDFLVVFFVAFFVVFLAAFLAIGTSFLCKQL